jgi:HD-like signal output (HDOD) protein
MDNNNTSALEHLIATMQGDKGFPALSSTINEINKIVASESESANKLTKAILQDLALTNRLLRLVNTVSYGQFGGKINTISKAVVILGFETIRNVAMSLILLEFLQNKSQAVQLRDEVLSSFFAGLVARQLSHGRNVRDTEEAMICAMFHKLGKLMAMFYLYDESQQIANLIKEGMSEAQATIQVLGISYDDLGTGLMKSWNFPDRLQSGMRKISGDKVRKPKDELEHLNVAVNLANELCHIAANTAMDAKQEAINGLVEKYRDAIHLSEQQLNHALEHGLAEVQARASILNLPTSNSPLLKTVASWSGHQEAEETPDTESEAMNGITTMDAMVEESRQDETQPVDPEVILGDGIQDVTNTLVAEYNLNDILQMVLETMYRGMKFQRVIAFIRDLKTSTMRARFGFGADIDGLLPKLFFPIKFEPDVFHVALEKGVDIVIEDVSANNIASKIPQWYQETLQAECFMLLPIMINDKAIGLIYADMHQANSLQISPRQLSLLRTLRNQTVLAIKQKQ